MGYSGDDCDNCEDLRREIADLQSTIEHKKKECLELLARGDRFFEGQQRLAHLVKFIEDRLHDDGSYDEDIRAEITKVRNG